MNFKSKRVTVVAAVLTTILLQTFTSAQTLNQNPGFPDVPQSHWARQSVEIMARSGLIEGDQQDHFRGDDGMTRYEFSMTMTRLISGFTYPPMAAKNDADQVLDRLTAIENRLIELEKKLAVAPIALQKDDLAAVQTEVKLAAEETST